MFGFKVNLATNRRLPRTRFAPLRSLLNRGPFGGPVQAPT
jgi:hypothetical protein